MTTDVLQQSIDRFTQDPQSGRATPAATAELVNGHARISAGPFNWDSDLGPAVGGRNEAPSPTAYTLGALAGCAVAFINDTLAPEFEVEISGLSATASCGADSAGLLGVDGADPALSDIGVRITVTSSSPAERVAAMEQAWLERCPIYLALVRPNSVTVDFA